MPRHLLTATLCTAGILTAVALFPATSPDDARAAGADEHVSVELVMLVDSSGSIDSNEFDLQRQGYIDAFRDEALHEAVEIQDGVAVRLAYWANANALHATDWYVLRTARDCNDFAAVLASHERQFRGSTQMAPALNWAVDELLGNNISAARRVIDVSGDGICENYGASTGHGTLSANDNSTYTPSEHGPLTWQQTRDELVQNVIVLNGISIGPQAALSTWYADEIPHGTGSFAMHAEDFNAFGQGIKQKLLRELEPTFLNALYD